MRAIEVGIPVGPRFCGHTRDVYAGYGMELWHETIVPWNILRLVKEGVTERVYLFPGQLPAAKPEGCVRCEMEDSYYSDGQIAVITWEGPAAIDQAFAWASNNQQKATCVRA